MRDLGYVHIKPQKSRWAAPGGFNFLVFLAFLYLQGVQVSSRSQRKPPGKKRQVMGSQGKGHRFATLLLALLFWAPPRSSSLHCGISLLPAGEVPCWLAASSRGHNERCVLVSALSPANCKLEPLLSLSLGHSVPRYFGMFFEVLP